MKKSVILIQQIPGTKEGPDVVEKYGLLFEYYFRNRSAF